MKRRVLLLAWVLTAASCGGGVEDARDQWTVSVTTDAAIPQFGDRILLEVLSEAGEERACETCRFTLGAPEMWPASFGIVPGEGGHPLVRARLYRASYAGPQGLPTGPAVIDALGRLPPSNGVREVALHLSLRCFGIPTDVERAETCDPESGALAPAPELATARGPAPPPGSSDLLRSVPCEGDLPEGMVCIEGGTFLRGTPLGFALDVLMPSPESLVTLSPFAFDAEEMTLGQVRTLLREGRITGEPTVRNDENPLEAACTYLGLDDPSNDPLPVTCVTAALAGSVCSALGKRLPTEAEWEYAAGNRARETTFPWGENDDVCAHAVVARGRALIPGILEETACLDGSFRSVGPVALGSELDVTDLGVWNLGGNVSEWVLDTLSPYGSDCWGGSSSLRDPRCEDGSAEVRSLRGGSWASREMAARVTSRNGAHAGLADPYTGFRCAMTMAQ